MFKSIYTTTYYPVVVSSRFMDADAFNASSISKHVAEHTLAGDEISAWAEGKEETAAEEAQRGLEILLPIQKFFIDNYGGPDVREMDAGDCISTYGNEFLSDFSGMS